MILGNILSKVWVRISGPPPMHPPLSLLLVPPQSPTSAPATCLTTSAPAPWHNCLLSTHLILRYPLPTPVWPFRPHRHQLFPLELPKCIYPKPPIFCPRSNLNLNDKPQPQPQPKPKTIPTHQPVQHRHQAPPQPVAQPLVSRQH